MTVDLDTEEHDEWKKKYNSSREIREGMSFSRTAAGKAPSN